MPELPPEPPSVEESLTYGRYLDLERLLSAQHPRSSPEHHDELLFIIQHQTTELWFKLILHELRAVRACLDGDLVAPARKGLARVKRIMDTLAEQWAVLATLTPSEYTEFRDVLATSSGFESFQYRCVEFLLGNKSERMLRVFADDPAEHDALAAVLAEPTVYDAFLSWLARRGHQVPASVTERDVTTAWEHHEELVPVLGRIYEDRSAYWTEYALCEDLVDLEEAFQQWRFRHMRTVQRIIGSKPGTGGSSGVDFLKRALDRTFFPELYTLRAHLGES